MNHVKLYRKVTNLHSLIPYSFFNGYAFFPLNVFFELTYKCNLRCSMCQFLPLVNEYKNIVEHSSCSELSFEEIKDTIKQVSRLSLLTFTGGEPLLRKDILDILGYASKKNKCHIITNGTLLEGVASELVDLGSKSILEPGLIMIGVSIEGTEDVHDKITDVSGSFQKSINSIKLVNELKRQKKQEYPLISISVVVTSENIHILPEILDLAKSLDVNILNFLAYNKYPHFDRLKEKNTVLRQASNGLGDIDRDSMLTQINRIMADSAESKLQVRFSPVGLSVDELADHYTGNTTVDDYICHSPWTRVVITACGDVIPCLNYTLGNIKTEKFSAIWNGSKYKSFRSKLKSKSIFPECMGCCGLESKS